MPWLLVQEEGVEALGFLCASPCVPGTAALLRTVNTVIVCAVYLAAQKGFS